ncbi:MAG: S-layer homology domain-containing protein, partial [Oscillospiraceae bacterium]|nr:S-layer homology domain-containing protein [Oscillospiraceae bacterium]
RSPETPEMISWIMNGSIVSSSMSSYNTGEPKDIAGAALMDYLVGEVDSDGIPNENSPSYNSLWITNILGIADILYGYPLNPTEDLNDLFLNPKLRKMLSANVALTLGGYYTAQIGDTGSFAGSGLVVDQADSLLALKYVEDKRLAQAVYMFNGNKLDGLNGSIFDENPEKITDFIEKTIEEEGELNLSSDMLAGFGFAVLRKGEKYNSAASGTQNNTIRDVAMYFGSTDGHGHSDGFNLFMSAFGLNIAPENGYPEQTGSQPNRLEWNRATLAHNTVTVNESKQNNVSTPRTTPYHFDDSGKVRLMDVGSTVHYTIDDYRRTVMMVDVDDENSYTVDFFHVKGGDDHIYSFHSQSDEITAISGFNSEPVITPMYTDELGNLYGTYAGADVKYGPDPTGWPNLTYPCGSTWLKNVRTYNDMENTFSWEYKVKDWRKKLTVNRDIRLRMTMLNDEPMEEVAFAVGLPPQKDSNADIGDVEYILVKNKGHNLDTTFTTVIEPYDASNKYIKAIEKVSMVRDENSKPGVNDAYSAVKITLENDRVDYIVYSTNNTVDYTIDGKLRFRGFAGVLSLDGDGNVIYRYLNDGEVLGLIGEEASEKTAAYTGVLGEFTRELSLDNTLEFKPDAGQNIDLDELAGRYVYVAANIYNPEAYKIESAKALENGSILLDIGDVTLVRDLKNGADISLGYTYHVEEGQKLRIPLSSTESTSPTIEQVEDVTTSAGSSITIPLNASGYNGREIQLIGTTLPRGMTLDAEKQQLKWKPDSSQVGENHVAITVSDGSLQETIHFYVTVYGSTMGGAGGSGGAATPSTPGADDDSLPLEGKVPSEDEADEVENNTTSNVRFIDLENHAWAKDSINALADAGIIKGTTPNTFSPANNITRADFALLLVRAFKLTSDNAENFADVNTSDYFARELAIARNTGIVNGIGDNKYAPRNFITRQDMMVIVYRALNSLLLEVAERERSVGAAMNDSPVDYQNRDVTEPQRDKGDRRTAVDEVLSQ